ncbi:MAG: 50S ribosomal protein L18 [Candidatus Levybacteria bacterium]|nr:50S ribosomal protein L18 [Candidatus Levybacteria bacterium]
MNRKHPKIQRQIRVRKKAVTVSDRPRLTVFRSNNYVYAQIIDTTGKTIVGISEKALKADAKLKPVERARLVGAEIAKLAVAKKVKDVAFDKGRFAYHGRVKAIAEGAREGGLNL